MKRILIFTFIVGVLLSIGVLSFDLYMDKKVKEIVDREFFDKTDASYEDIDFSLFNRSVVIKKVVINNEEGSLYSENIYIYRYDDNFNMEVMFEDIQGLTGEYRKMYVEFLNFLRDYGYEDPKINLYLEMETDKEKEILKINKFSLIVPDAFSVGFFLEIGNFDQEFWEGFEDYVLQTQSFPINFLSELGAIEIIELGILIENEGFKERFLSIEADKHDIEVEDMKKEIRANFTKLSEDIENPKLQEIVKQISYFTERGKFLKLYIKPKKPFKIQELLLFIGTFQGNEDELIAELLEYLNIKAEVY